MSTSGDSPTIGSLFTGYGGLDMAVQSVYGGDLAWYAEIDAAACKVLTAHHPDVSNLGNVNSIDWTTVPPVDILTAGYPCQPFSHAGNRKGSDDERHLWPRVRDAIGTLRPGLVVLENVAGHLTLGFADVLADLAHLGMSAQWGVVRASDAGACHQRKRLFIIAYPNSQRLEGFNSSPRAAQTGRYGHFEQGPIGLFAANAGGERYGSGEGSAGMAGMGGAAKVSGWQASAAWSQSRAGGHEPAANTVSGSFRGTGATQNGLRVTAECRDQPAADTAVTDWGKYEPAIRRWGNVIGRSAPAPTIPGHEGRPRLSPRFVEWMMGLPDGHVTGHGLKGNACLKMLGNGVVPQQAILALRLLGTR